MVSNTEPESLRKKFGIIYSFTNWTLEESTGEVGSIMHCSK